MNVLDIIHHPVVMINFPRSINLFFVRIFSFSYIKYSVVYSIFLLSYPNAGLYFYGID